MKQRKREKQREGASEGGRGEWVRKKEIHPGTSRNGHIGLAEKQRTERGGGERELEDGEETRTAITSKIAATKSQRGRLGQA